MKSKRISNGTPEQTYAVIFQTGDEVISGLQAFADRERLGAAQFTAIGAFSGATIAWFDWETKQYRKIPVRQQVEVLNLAGDVTLKPDGKRQIHAHVVLGTSDGSVKGGHLIEAHVRPTLEVILSEAPAQLRRKHDEASGLALINLDESS